MELSGRIDDSASETRAILVSISRARGRIPGCGIPDVSYIHLIESCFILTESRGMDGHFESLI